MDSKRELTGKPLLEAVSDLSNADDAAFVDAQLKLFATLEYKTATAKKKIEMLKDAIGAVSLAVPSVDLGQRGLRDRIRQLLKDDAAARRPGNHGQLYHISDLAPFARLGHGVPTVRNVRNVEFDRALDRVESDDAFRARLWKHAPFLEGFDLIKHGLVLAGGAAAGILMRQEKLYKDFDMFVVGHGCDHEALGAITKFANHLYVWHVNQCRAKGAEYIGNQQPMRVCRTRGCITFVLPFPGQAYSGSIQIQVILRRYDYLKEVIRGFDLGSSAVAWDGEHVVLTELGKFAAEHGANILNLAGRRGSYERRLSRYFQRGYDVVLPDLSRSFLGKRYHYLPYMDFRGFDSEVCCACHMEARSIEPTDPGHQLPQSTETTDDEKNVEADRMADRSIYEAGMMEYASVELVNANNASALDRALRTNGAAHVNRWLCACENYNPGMSFANMMPALDEMMWLDVISSACRSGRSMGVQKLKSLLGAPTAKAVACMLIAGKADPTDTYWGPHDYQRACYARFQELQSMIVPIPLEFRNVADATSLCGDAELSAEDWYGSDFNSKV